MDVAVGVEPSRFKKNGEESYLAEQISANARYFGVAEGFGSLRTGKVSSAPLALTLARDYLKRKAKTGLFTGGVTNAQGFQQATVAALGYANAYLYARSGSNDDFVAGGISVATLLVVGHHAFITHVGDARMYVLRRGRFECLTFDDAVAIEEVPSAPSPLASKPRLRSLLWRSLGAQERLEAGVSHFELLPGDRLFLCTSGIHRTVAIEEIAGALVEGPKAAEALNAVFALLRTRGVGEGGAAVLAFDPLLAPIQDISPKRFFFPHQPTIYATILLVTAIGALFFLRGFRFAP